MTCVETAAQRDEDAQFSLASSCHPTRLAVAHRDGCSFQSTRDLT